VGQIHGKNADLKLSGSALEADGNNVTLDISVDTAEVTAFGDTYKDYLEGVAEWSITAEFFFDGANAKAADVAFDMIGSGKKAVIFYPGGSSATNIYYSGSAIVTRKNITAPVGGAVTVSLTLQGSGTLAKTGSS